MHKLFLPLVIFTILFSSATVSTIPFAYAQIVKNPGENVLSIDSFDPILRKINPDTGATISSVEITLAGETVNGGRGLAFSPADGKLYAFLKIDGSGDTFLVTLNLQTGVATLVGDTGDRFNALAFNSAGNLFAASARNAGVSDTLFTMSTVDASSIALCELPSNGGQGLALNPVDGFLYHYTFDDFNRIVDTSVDPCGLTNIPTTSGGEFNTALTFRTSTGEFLFGEDGTRLFTLSAAGQGPDSLSFLDAQPRGLAIIGPFVGGELLPIDSTALILAGLQSSAIWMLPVLAGAAGVGAFYIKTRMNKK